MEISKLKNFNNISMYGHPSSGAKLKGRSLVQQNSNNITKNRPAERESLSGSERSGQNISFTGDPKLVTKIAKEALDNCGQFDIPAWAKKMGGANWFNNVLKSVNKNETFYEAVIALGVAGILKPICVLSMPGAEMEDKQMSATKNFVSAVAGFGLSNLILSPCSTAVNKITDSIESKNPTKYIKDMRYVEALRSEELMTTAKGTKLKSTLGEAFKSTFKKCPDMAVSPLKAAITLAVMPYVLKFLFGKDKKSSDKKEKPATNPLVNMTVMNSIRMKNNENLKQSKPSFGANSNNSPSFKGHNTLNDEPAFKGGVSQVIDIAQEGAKAAKKSVFGRAKDAYCEVLSRPIAKVMGKLTDFSLPRKIVEGSAHFDKVSARWSDMASFAITYCYVRNTAKSEKIDEERKLPLMINNIMVTAASSTAAALIDKFTDKPMEDLLKGYISTREVELFDKSNKQIKKTLDIALKEGKEAVDLDALKRHSKDLLEGGAENINQNLKAAITALQNDSTIQKAIKEKLIDADDIAKIAASGFEKQASKIFKNIRTAKSLTVFTITVRFLVTVLMTPVIGRVVDIVNRKLGRGKYAQDKEPIFNAPPAGSETLGFRDYLASLK